MRNLENKIKQGVLGPGGWKCTCCGPNPSYRKKHKRHLKRGKLKRLKVEEIRRQMED